MKNYRVEEMENDDVRRVHVVKASTPFEAAAKVVNQEVALSKQREGDWVRVTDKMKGLVFEYRAVVTAEPQTKRS
ncbi:hypothetical protein BPNPMPFG_002442 [Mesorhizobium sp. AR07]|uniref:hypothetical protein n=1 Tax=Mesorhizobium sp. AR07 TaxID=2865838 RepID=UPI002160975E|nr:hypothetical protein [Mesorhizobium sp. AR07]UVK46736.1 hypothetical protein BPNPMPFG_002442 [Mesorhizobium sp. AR07]